VISKTGFDSSDIHLKYVLPFAHDEPIAITQGARIVLYPNHLALSSMGKVGGSGI